MRWWWVVEVVVADDRRKRTNCNRIVQVVRCRSTTKYRICNTNYKFNNVKNSFKRNLSNEDSIGDLFNNKLMDWEVASQQNVGYETWHCATTLNSLLTHETPRKGTISSFWLFVQSVSSLIVSVGCSRLGQDRRVMSKIPGKSTSRWPRMGRCKFFRDKYSRFDNPYYRSLLEERWWPRKRKENAHSFTHILSLPYSIRRLTHPAAFIASF